MVSITLFFVARVVIIETFSPIFYFLNESYQDILEELLIVYILEMCEVLHILPKSDPIILISTFFL